MPPVNPSQLRGVGAAFLCLPGTSSGADNRCPYGQNIRRASLRATQAASR